MSMTILVQIAELSAAAAKMNEALEAYRQATGDVKTAAADLASKWEGAAKDAFVNDQENAYNWYVSLTDVVYAIIEEARRCIDRYREAEERLKSVMKG
ncbi:MAG: WXG100 family type VII secretion target [Candidatus Faecivicinus sp.]